MPLPKEIKVKKAIWSKNTIFDGRISICDFKHNSTYVGEISNCKLFNDDLSKTCKECEENYVIYEDPNNQEISCIFHTECTNGLIEE